VSETDFLMQPGMEVPDLTVTHNNIVLAAIEQLSDRHRLVIEAIFFERISYGKLATRMGFSKPYVWRTTKKAVDTVGRIIASDPHILKRYQ